MSWKSDKEQLINMILSALAHPVRRRIIRALGDHGEKNYADLMRLAGIEDSGTFAFHLRRLKGFVEKDEEKGTYRLTELGWKAYRVLKQMELEEEITPTPTTQVARVIEAVGERQEKPKVERKTISDRPYMRLTRSHLEECKKLGVKLLIEDVDVLTIEDVPPNLFRDVVESIRDVALLIAPKQLAPIIDFISEDVSDLRYYDPQKEDLDDIEKRLGLDKINMLDRPIKGCVGGLIEGLVEGIGGFIEGVVEGIIGSIDALVGSLAGKLPTLLSPPKSKDSGYTVTAKPDAHKLVIDAEACRLDVKHSSDAKDIIVKVNRSDVRAYFERVDENTLRLKVKGVSKDSRVEVLMPKGWPRDMHLRLGAVAINYKDFEVNRMIVEGGALAGTFQGQVMGEKPLLSVNVEAAAVKFDLKGDWNSTFKVDVRGNANAIKLKLHVPKDTSIRLVHEGDFSTALSVKGVKCKGLPYLAQYCEEIVEGSSRDVDVRVSTKASSVAIYFERYG